MNKSKPTSLDTATPEELFMGEEKVEGRAGEGVDPDTLDRGDTLTSTLFKPSVTMLQGVFPWTCGKCRRENSVRYPWQYFCGDCMDEMRIGADKVDMSDRRFV